jgi:small-conductance mechanosensitive channel
VLGLLGGLYAADPERFSSDWWWQVFFGGLLRVLVILIVGLVVRFILIRLVRRIVKSAAAKPVPGEDEGGRTQTARVVFGDDPVALERRASRAKTLGSLFESIVNLVVWTLTILLIAAQLGFNLGPLLAGAGILGVALGFGAQSVVADFLSGVFMLLEDEYGVGDYIDMGEASGTVEDVGLRVTRLRGVDGVVWFVRNGEVVRVGNHSHGWSSAILDIGVAYGTDVGAVRQVLDGLAEEVMTDSPVADLLLERPTILGVQELAADSVVIRMVIKTQPGEQWVVARYVRERVKEIFDAEGIEIPFPQRTVWNRNDSAGATAPGSAQVFPDVDDEPTVVRGRAPGDSPGEVAETNSESGGGPGDEGE